jgi:hypothetical protein
MLINESFGLLKLLRGICGQLFGVSNIEIVMP